MDTVQNILRRREERRLALEKALVDVIRQLEAMGALKIILFGSLARGEVNSWSDLDLIAVMPPHLSGREWMRKIYDEVERGIACDILAYTEKELAEMWPVSGFVRHALKEGKVVYEKKP